MPGDSDAICDIWTEINRNLAAEFEAEGWPELTPLEYVARREVMDYRVMERLRQRVESIVNDKATAEALKPWYRFLCKRPCSNNDYYQTYNRPNVKLLDVRSEEHTSELQSLMRISYAVFCLKKKKNHH